MISFVTTLLFLACGALLFRRWRDATTSALPSFDSATHTHTTTSSLLVSVIIPARNEASNLQRLLPALLAQHHAPVEIIVVDDHSEDETAAVAASYAHVRVVSAPALPAGWVGKSWACTCGANVARGDLLLFLDADTLPTPHFLRWIVHVWQQHGGLLTVQPYHTVTHAYEQASAFFNLIVLAGSAQFSPYENLYRSFGPCALCARTDYDHVGGHATIRDEVLEHLQLGQTFEQHGFAHVAYGGRGALSFRMYPQGALELVRGWMKSIALGAGSTALFPLLLCIGWIVGLYGALFYAVEARTLFSVVIGIGLYGGAAWQVWHFLRRAGSFSVFVALAYPLYLTFFVGVMCASFVRSFGGRNVSWKGRTIAVKHKKK